MQLVEGRLYDGARLVQGGHRIEVQHGEELRATDLLTKLASKLLLPVACSAAGTTS